AQNSDETPERRTADSEGEDRAFEVAIDFERFGKTVLSGRISKTALFVTLESQKALPRDLRQELNAVFAGRGEACGLTGGLNFKSARSAAHIG
ncbi:MAG: hypothetical protein AAF337_14905, partial [Pseudomonadota bacterium]